MNATGEIDGLGAGSLAVSLTVAAALALIGICKKLKKCSSSCDDHTASLTIVREIEEVRRRMTVVEDTVSREPSRTASPAQESLVQESAL